MSRIRIIHLTLAGLLASTLALAGPDRASHVRFESVQGHPVSLSDYRGQVVVLNLWAIWCGPCIGEIPELMALQSRIEARGATVIGLAVDSGSADQILRFWRRRLDLEPGYPLWLTSMDSADEAFDATTVPLTLLIDRDGEIRERLLGAHDAETFLEKLEPLL
jgi:peroxiredoxin